MYQCPRCSYTSQWPMNTCPHCGVGFSGTQRVDRLMPDRVALEVERKRKLEERERKFKEFCDKHPKLVQWGEKLRAMVSATNFGGIMLVSMLFSVFGGLAGFLLNVCTWLIKGTAFSIAHVEWGIRIAFIILLLKRGRPSRKDMIGVITLFILGVLLIPAVLAGLGSAVSHGDCSWGLLRLMVGWCLFVAGPICGVEAAKSLYSLYEFKRIGYVHPGRLILYSFFVTTYITFYVNINS